VGGLIKVKIAYVVTGFEVFVCAIRMQQLSIIMNVCSYYTEGGKWQFTQTCSGTNLTKAESSVEAMA
jgi:hypothetical protein